MINLKAVAFDELIERDIMEGEGDAEMAAKLKRFVDIHGVSVVGLLQCLPHRTSGGHITVYVERFLSHTFKASKSS